MKINFEWDPVKAASNLQKHGVSFETATRVFLDPDCFQRRDDRDFDEERWQTIGRVGSRTVLLVAHTTREGPILTVRIISAREATRKERTLYEKKE